MKTKKNNLVIFAVIFIIIGIFVFPSIRLINRSPVVCSAEAYNDHYYALADIHWIFQRKWTVGTVTFANPNPDYSTPSSSANHTIWVTTTDDTDSWMEAGYAKGWWVNGDLDPNIRTLYWAYKWGPTNEYHEDEALTPPGLPGTVHTYTILRNGADGSWNLYIDGYYEKTFPPYFLSYAKDIQVGLESFDYANLCTKVYSTDMRYYYESEGWYSFGEANPSIYTSNSYYHFYFTNSSKDSAVDYNGNQ